jgi:two-component system chemotaxis response regulator CheB
MAIRVLIVDDSRFFQRRVTDILKSDSGLEVVGVAGNGAEAIELVQQLKPDVITMDIEMPVMDGITAVRHIMQTRPTPILMFSALTTEGAQATLAALEAGAVDYLPKRFDDISQNPDAAKKILCERVRQIAREMRTIKRVPAPEAGVSARPSSDREGAGSRKAESPRPSCQQSGFQLLLIGASTGGPVALQSVLACLSNAFPAPIVIVQHMPATFTPAFAKRLDGICAINVKEAQNGDILTAGTAYLAPGGRQTFVERKSGAACLRIADAQAGEIYRPSIDMTFSSVAASFSGKVLSVILTGMGADGRDGARELKKHGSTVWAQDEATSVVYGMPAAVVNAGLADEVLPLDEIGEQLIRCF